MLVKLLFVLVLLGFFGSVLAGVPWAVTAWEVAAGALLDAALAASTWFVDAFIRPIGE